MRDTQVEYTETFDLPDDFDVDEYFQGEFGIFHSDKKQKIIIDFDAKGAEYIRLRKAHPTQELTRLPGGGVRLTMTVGDLTTVTSWVLEWGPRARVVEPAELVDRVREELSEALKGYAPKPRTR
jgi:predicted DNA-binding transcriptional regulator YafY